MRWHMSFVAGSSVSLEVSASLQAAIPSWWGIFMYREVMSRVARGVPGGRGGSWWQL